MGYYWKKNFWTFRFSKTLCTRKKSSNLGKFPHIQAKIFQNCIFCITKCINFHTHVIVWSVHFSDPTDRFQPGVNNFTLHKQKYIYHFPQKNDPMGGEISNHNFLLNIFFRLRISAAKWLHAHVCGCQHYSSNNKRQ